MMAAVAAKGQSMIFNAAREPEIEDLQSFLNLMGCQVAGAGTSTVTISGGFDPRPVTYHIIPDRIVAGTLMCAAAITGGDIQLNNVRSAHLGSVVSKLREAGCVIDVYDNSLRVRGPSRPRELKLVETLPHPGFPTDMQAQVFALCTIADGTSIIVENVFENRFKHASELSRMGAVSMLKDRTAIIRGVPRLTGAQVTARDLRGGAALVLAGLCADGTTIVNSAEHIDRGYDRFEDMLNKLGAEIYREN
jgi:UDP-N-acetylglucosamine 1-carboxyvinyltransferase